MSMDIELLAEDLIPADEVSRIMNRHNATAFVDATLRKEYYLTFDDKTKKKVHFSPTFIGACDEFFKRECHQGKPKPVNRWSLFPGHYLFESNDWWKKNKDREVCVWSYWHGGTLVASLLINPIIMNAIAPYDYRQKGQDREVDHRASMRKMKLESVIHKINALLTS